MRKTFVISMIAALLCSGAGLADNQNIVVSVVPQPNSPIAIGDCEIESHPTSVLLNGSRMQGLDIVTGVTFTNMSRENVIAVKFGFVFLDAFGTIVGKTTGVNTGYYSPGVPIRPKLGLGDVLQPGSPGVFHTTIQGTAINRLDCLVLEARYADGTIWSVKSKPKHSRHLARRY